MIKSSVIAPQSFPSAAAAMSGNPDDKLAGNNRSIARKRTSISNRNHAEAPQDNDDADNLRNDQRRNKTKLTNIVRKLLNYEHEEEDPVLIPALPTKKKYLRKPFLCDQQVIPNQKDLERLIKEPETLALSSSQWFRLPGAEIMAESFTEDDYYYHMTLFDIYAYERRYLQYLAILIVEFKQKLRPLMASQDADRVFLTIDALFVFHAQFYDYLHAQWNGRLVIEVPVEKIIDLMRKTENDYAVYCCRHPGNMDLLNSLRDSDERLDTAFKRVHTLMRKQYPNVKMNFYNLMAQPYERMVELRSQIASLRRFIQPVSSNAAVIARLADAHKRCEKFDRACAQIMLAQQQEIALRMAVLECRTTDLELPADASATLKQLLQIQKDPGALKKVADEHIHRLLQMPFEPIFIDFDRGSNLKETVDRMNTANRIIYQQAAFQVDFSARRLRVTKRQYSISLFSLHVLIQEIVLPSRIVSLLFPRKSKRRSHYYKLLFLPIEYDEISVHSYPDSPGMDGIVELRLHQLGKMVVFRCASVEDKNVFIRNFINIQQYACPKMPIVCPYPEQITATRDKLVREHVYEVVPTSVKNTFVIQENKTLLLESVDCYTDAELAHAKAMSGAGYSCTLFSTAADDGRTATTAAGAKAFPGIRNIACVFYRFADGAWMSMGKCMAHVIPSDLHMHSHEYELVVRQGVTGNVIFHMWAHALRDLKLVRQSHRHLIFGAAYKSERPTPYQLRFMNADVVMNVYNIINYEIARVRRSVAHDAAAQDESTATASDSFPAAASSAKAEEQAASSAAEQIYKGNEAIATRHQVVLFGDKDTSSLFGNNILLSPMVANFSLNNSMPLLAKASSHAGQASSAIANGKSPVSLTSGTANATTGIFYSKMARLVMTDLDIVGEKTVVPSTRLYYFPVGELLVRPHPTIPNRLLFIYATAQSGWRKDTCGIIVNFDRNNFISSKQVVLEVCYHHEYNLGHFHPQDGSDQKHQPSSSTAADSVIVPRSAQYNTDAGVVLNHPTATAIFAFRHDDICWAFVQLLEAFYPQKQQQAGELFTDHTQQNEAPSLSIANATSTPQNYKADWCMECQEDKPAVHSAAANADGNAAALRLADFCQKCENRMQKRNEARTKRLQVLSRRKLMERPKMAAPVTLGQPFRFYAAAKEEGDGKSAKDDRHYEVAASDEHADSAPSPLQHTRAVADSFVPKAVVYSDNADAAIFVPLDQQTSIPLDTNFERLDPETKAKIIRERRFSCASRTMPLGSVAISSILY